MRVFRSPDKHGWEKEIGSLALGTMSGLALGALISRALPPGRRFDAARRVRTAADRIRPAPLRRLLSDQEDLNDLESAVLDGFLNDAILANRGVDVGAISRGIIELSGSVWTEEEASRAVTLARRIPGVETVVNRLEIEDLAPRRIIREEEGGSTFSETFGHQEGRVGGMGRRRQGNETDPGRPDDSQSMRERALAAADRDEMMDEDLMPRAYETRARREVQSLNPTSYSEDELDNQDPHGKHTRTTLDRPPEELNSFARVGEGSKPRTELRLERTDREAEGEIAKDHEG